MKRVVFFQPRTHASDNYRTTAGGEQRWAPWAALALSPLARELGFDVNLIDARVDTEDWMYQTESLTSNDLLAVSVMTGHAIRDAIRASVIAQQNGTKVVWGGPHVSLFPIETIEQAPVDAVIPGFGYAPFAHILSVASENEWPSANDGGVVFKAALNYQTRQTVSTALPHIHPPYLGLVNDWAPYLNQDVAIATRTINYFTSEGCPRKCTFCSEPRTSSGMWLTRDLYQTISVAQELRERSNANGLKLHDPNFFHDINRALQFSNQFFNVVGIPWAASIHPSDLMLIPESSLCDLFNHGLVRLLIGLESPDAQILKLAGKQYDPKKIPELARKLARAKIRGMFTFIVGWPDSDPDHYGRTINCAMGIRDIWPEHQAKIHFLEPWPGTPIFELIKRRGFLFPNKIYEWANIDYYQAQYTMIHDQTKLSEIRDANRRLSPYVTA